MRELDYILQLRRDIVSIDVRLTELESMVYPQAMNVSDMPRGGGHKNSLEEYIIKWDRLHNKRHRLEVDILMRWAAIEKVFNECGVTAAQQAVMKFRFFCGFTWKKCVNYMRAEYPETGWDEQKLFRIYRKVLLKMPK